MAKSAADLGHEVVARYIAVGEGPWDVVEKAVTKAVEENSDAAAQDDKALAIAAARTRYDEHVLGLTRMAEFQCFQIIEQGGGSGEAIKEFGALVTGWSVSGTLRSQIMSRLISHSASISDQGKGSS